MPSDAAASQGIRPHLVYSIDFSRKGQAALRNKSTNTVTASIHQRSAAIIRFGEGV